MESIAEILYVKRQCSICKVLRDEDQFAGCQGKRSLFKTYHKCREQKKKYRDKLKSSLPILIDDSVSVSSSSSSCPRPPPGLPAEVRVSSESEIEEVASSSSSSSPNISSLLDKLIGWCGRAVHWAIQDSHTIECI